MRAPGLKRALSGFVVTGTHSERSNRVGDYPTMKTAKQAGERWHASGFTVKIIGPNGAQYLLVPKEKPCVGFKWISVNSTRPRL